MQREFDREELAAIMRLVAPTREYLGDPPELWMRDSLMRFIRIAIADRDDIPARTSVHFTQRSVSK